MSLFHDTGQPLPDNAHCYRKIGPFARHLIPAPLLSSHSLKHDCWAILTVRSGDIGFVWEDGTAPRALTKGDAIVIPPSVPHHLEVDKDVEIEIAFYNRKA